MEKMEGKEGKSFENILPVKNYREVYHYLEVFKTTHAEITCYISAKTYNQAIMHLVALVQNLTLI